jgi:acyl-CoA thioesterase
VFPRPADDRLIPIEFNDDRTRGRFELGEGHARFDGNMYGGTGIAAAVMAMEAATQRAALWTTIQCVSSPHSGSVVELAIDTLATGKRVSQVQVTGRVAGDVAFVALGSTAIPRENGLEGQFFEMPAAAAPEDAPPRFHVSSTFRQHAHEHSYDTRVDMRSVDSDRNVLIWARLVDETALTPAGIAFVADMVPIAITRAAGKLGAGHSLDNAMRFGPDTGPEWVLLELIGDLAAGGYGHGSLRAWSADGTLVATGGQTANMRFVADTEEEFAARVTMPRS